MDAASGTARRAIGLRGRWLGRAVEDRARAKTSGRWRCEVSGARDNFLSRNCRSVNVFAQISSQRNFSGYQTARRLNDQMLRPVGPAHKAHCYRARVGDRLFELLDIRHRGLPPVVFRELSR
jgi:hypothetical protein